MGSSCGIVGWPPVSQSQPLDVEFSERCPTVGPPRDAFPASMYALRLKAERQGLALRRLSCWCFSSNQPEPTHPSIATTQTPLPYVGVLQRVGLWRYGTTSPLFVTVPSRPPRNARPLPATSYQCVPKAFHVAAFVSCFGWRSPRNRALRVAIQLLGLADLTRGFVFRSLGG